MDPQALQQLQFGGGVSETIMSPVTLLCVLVAGIMIWMRPRRQAIIPFLTACLLIPTDQVLVLGSLHFQMLRIVALVGLGRALWLKISAKEKIFSGGMNGIDKALIVLSLSTLVSGVLLWRVWGELIYQLGYLCDAFGLYFSLRFMIRDEDDVARALRVLACIASVVAVLMICEQVTGKNPLYIALGGARASALGSVLSRGESLRATGSFAHPNLAGTFGGMMLPLFVGFYSKATKYRKYAILGIVSAITISFAASSSTALFGFLGGLLALCFWPLRRRMRIIRWGIVIVLVSLHLVMKAPVWHLISRVDLTGSSSSYHRYELVNQCILHFWDWALIGTKDFGNWGWDTWDISNQYIAIADTTGLIPLLSFLTIIVLGFKYLGSTRRVVSRDKKKELLIWGIASSLFANVVAFFGISYFDQTIVAWYALLAMIAATAVSARKEQRDHVTRGSKSKTPMLDFDSNQERIAVGH